MRDIHRLLGSTIWNRDLNASRIRDASVYKTNAVQYGPNELDFSLKAAVHHFLTRVPVGEISVETHLREALDESNRSPHILANGGAVRFDVKRNMRSLRSLQNSLDQARSFVVVFETPADVNSDTFEAFAGGVFRQSPCVVRSVHTTARGDPEFQNSARLQFGGACRLCKL